MNNWQEFFQQLIEPLLLWQRFALAALGIIIVLCVILLIRAQRTKKRYEAIQARQLLEEQDHTDALFDHSFSFTQSSTTVLTKPEHSESELPTTHSTASQGLTHESPAGQSEQPASAMPQTPRMKPPAPPVPPLAPQSPAQSQQVPRVEAVAERPTVSAPRVDKARNPVAGVVHQSTHEEAPPTNLLDTVIECWKKGQNPKVSSTDRVQALRQGLELIHKLPADSVSPEIKNDWPFMFESELRVLQNKQR